MSPITQETFVWPFKDSDWKNKFLVGSLLALAIWIPVVGLLSYAFLYGYGLIVMRAGMRGEVPTLPKWENVSELFVDGFKAALSAIGYVLPGILTIVVAYIVFIAGIFLTAATSDAGRAPSSTFPAVMAFSYLTFFALLGVSMVLSLVGMVITPVAVGQYARTGQIGSGYRLRQVWAILRANAGGYLIAWALFWGLTMALGFVVSILYYTIILCCLLPFVTAPVSFYITILWSTLFGPAYREGWMKVEKTLSIQPVQVGTAN